MFCHFEAKQRLLETHGNAVVFIPGSSEKVRLGRRRKRGALGYVEAGAD